ncbi:Fic family protein [Arcicella aurantiaca]|nr:Fic family protein [Arcicella aurantiaca]
MKKTESLMLTKEFVNLMTEIDEFKGAWLALGNIAPDRLLQLRKVATIESIASSTRIEGSLLTDRQVEKLIGNLQIQKFETRDEQEVAGYADLMSIVFDNYNDMPLSENFIKQLHGYLMTYSEKDQWHKGQYKKFPNHVVATDGFGQVIGIVFETTTPLETPVKMQELVDWTVENLNKRDWHPLLVIAFFTVVFLTIHPFQDGNGRISRVLTTFLLLKAGYHYVAYSSLEAVIEQRKPDYYWSLRQTQTSLNQDEPNWSPWVLFFLKSLKQQKDNLEIKIKRERLLLTQLPNMSQTILDLLRENGRITIKELQISTQYNRNTLQKHLESLVKTNQIQQNGQGKGTWYSLI